MGGRKRTHHGQISNITDGGVLLPERQKIRNCNLLSVYILNSVVTTMLSVYIMFIYIYSVCAV